MHREIVHFAFNALVSGPTSGELGVILRDETVQFLRYSTEGIARLDNPFVLRIPVDVAAFGSQGDEAVIAFDNSNMLIHNIRTRAQVQRQLGVTNVHGFHFSRGDIFAISHETSMFRYTNGRVVQSPIAAKCFSLIGRDFLFVLGEDDVARVIAVDEWRLISARSDDYFGWSKQYRIVEHSPNDWFHPDARLVAMTIRDDPPIYLRGHFAAGDSREYDDLFARLTGRAEGPVTHNFKWIRAASELFADNFAGAAAALAVESGGDLSFDGAIAGLMIACAKEASDELRAHLKGLAIQLFAKGKHDRAAIFLRIARLDRMAADYLLGYEQFMFALKFIRRLEAQDKKDLLIKLGVRYARSGRTLDAMLVFAACKEFHVVLWYMVESKMTLDAFFLKKYLVVNGLLVEAPRKIAVLLEEIPDLQSLSWQIDSDFALEAANVEVDNKIIKALLT
jgi:hypothetical protein